MFYSCDRELFRTREELMEELQRSLCDGEGSFVSSRHTEYPVTPPAERMEGEPLTPPPTPLGELTTIPAFPHINQQIWNKYFKISSSGSWKVLKCELGSAGFDTIVIISHTWPNRDYHKLTVTLQSLTREWSSWFLSPSHFILLPSSTPSFTSVRSSEKCFRLNLSSVEGDICLVWFSHDRKKYKNSQNIFSHFYRHPVY